MDSTELLNDPSTQAPPPAQAPAAPHPLADLGFKPTAPAAPAAAAYPLADLGFKPTPPKTVVPTGPVAGAGPLGVPQVAAAPVPTGLQTPNVVPPPAAPAPPPGPAVAGAGPLGVPQLPAHPAANLQPSLVGDVAAATKEAITHPVETLVGADQPSQTAEKQASLEKAAATGDKQAQSALDVLKTEQAPTIHPSDTQTFQKVLDPKSKNVVSRVLTGGTKALEALSSPDNIGLMATLPFAPEDATKLLSGIFSTQMTAAAGSEGLETIRAAHRGEYGEAAEKGASTFITALMAAASAKHAAEATPKPSTTPSEVPRGTLPAEGEEKPTLHASDDVEELRKSAERQAPKIGDAAKAATEGVPGAKLEAVRDAKDSDRIEDKADRQDVKPSQIADIAAAKITVPDQEAADKVLENLHKTMPVESVNGAVDGAPGKNGVRQVQAVVDIGAGEGEPVKKAEILIQTPEMAEATDATHDDYRKAQELRQAGKDDEADAIEKQITARHEKAANGAEGQYKFGSTQTDIPADSEAHTALESARTKIDDKDLAGQGKDVGGNHVTVRYGIQGDDTAKIEKFLRTQPPFEAKLGDISSFPPSKNSDGAAVLKADIDAPELHRLNAEIEQHGDFRKSDFDEYKPHATIAYVKPEAVDKYVGKADTNGKTFQVREIAITDRNGDAKVIPLEGGKADDVKPVHGSMGTIGGWRKEYRSRLADPKLADRAKVVDYGDGTHGLAVPVGGERVSGNLDVDPAAVGVKPERLLAQLRDQPGFPNVRMEDGEVSWGEPWYEGRSPGEQFGYSEKAIKDFRDSADRDEEPQAMLPEATTTERKGGGGQLPEQAAGGERGFAPAAEPLSAPKPLSTVVKDATGREHNVPDWMSSKVGVSAPKPIEPKTASKSGKQATPVEVRVNGKWQPATLDYYPAEAPDVTRRGRATLDNGDKLASVKDADIRPLKALEPKKGTGGEAEASMSQQVRENGHALVSKYLADNTNDGVPYIAKDAVKQLFKEYRDDPTGKNNDANAPATAVQEEAFRRVLAEPVKDGRDVVQVATGSPASGKTTGGDGSVGSRIGVVRESILDNVKHGREVIDQILEAGRHPVLDVNFLDDPRKNAERMITRAGQIGRTVPLEYMAETYVNVPKVAEELKRIYGDKITVNSIDNSGAPGEMKAYADDGAAAVKASQAYTVDSAREAMLGEADRLSADGKSSEAIDREARRGLKAGTEAVHGGRQPEPLQGDRDEPQAERRKADELSGRQSDTGVAAERPKLGEGEVSPRTAAEGTKPVDNVGRRDAQAGGDDQRPEPDETVRRESKAADDSQRESRGRQDAEAKGNTERAAARKQQLDAATQRTLAENVAAHKSTVEEVGGRKAVVLDPSGEQVWHNLFQKIKGNPLGAGEEWRGVSLDRNGVNMAIAYLKGGAEDLRVAGIPETDGFDRLVDALKQARNDQGGVTVLRGDYRADTAREEATHQWQREHQLDRSDAMTEVAHRPEFEETVDRLRAMGYEDASPRTVATEIMAKAMAGDPALDLTDAERESLVRSFLTEAVEEKGPEILKNLPETDPRLKDVIDEVRKGYDDGDDHGGRNEAGGQQTVRGDDGQASRDLREAEPGTRDRTGSGDAGGEGLQPGDKEAALAKGELEAPKPPGTKPKETKAPEPPKPEASLFQRDKEAEKQNPWYLKSERVLEQKMKGPMPGGALVRMLENNGVKADELRWSGLEDLKDRARVTAAEVREHLAENALKIKEVTKGRGVPVDKDGNVSMDDVTHPDAPKFGQYVLPGGDNYREVLMTMPGDETKTLQRMKEQLSDWQKGPDFYFNSAEEYREKVDDLKAEIAGLTEKSKAFQSSHWDEPNVLAHVRMNDRSTPDGKELLHIEEIQSDWHQKGRSKGYGPEPMTVHELTTEDVPKAERGAWRPGQKLYEVRGQDGRRLYISTDKEQALQRAEVNRNSGVPDAPFKKDWHEMAFRRMVKYAADNGYDGVSWTPGDKQAERYDLSKQISRIDYGPSKAGDTATISAFDKEGSHIFTKNNVPRSEWQEIVGKDIAQKMDTRAGDVNDYTGYHSLSGVDLKTGGEGMKGFYDKIIPDYARKFGKQWGAKVEETPIGGDQYSVQKTKGYQGEDRWGAVDSSGFPVGSQFFTEAEAEADAAKYNADKGSFKVPYLEITPEMRKDVVEQGVSLFQKAKDDENPVAKTVSQLVEDLKALPKPDKGTMLDRVATWTKDYAEESLDRSTKAIGAIPSKFEKAFAWTKATSAALIHDYNNPLEQTDWKNVMGQKQLAEAETALHLQKLGEELKKQAPKEIDRIAMTHYMEAAGSEGKLKEWQAGNKARAMQEIGTDRGRYLRDAQKHYDKALDLSPEQKQLAKRLRQHFDDMLDIAKKNGLLEFGYRNYVMHMYEKDEASNLLRLVDNSELNPDPSFIKRRFHDTFYSAEGDGLTPKSKDIGHLLTAYDKSMNEGIASRTAIKGLLDAKAADGRPIAAIKTQGGWVIEKGDDARQVLNQRPRPQNMSMEGYKAIDRPQLRNFLFKPTTADLQGIDPQFMDEDLAFRGDLMIHPKYVDRVTDLLTPSWFERGESVPQKIGHAILKGSAAAKELMTVVAPFHLATEGRHALSHKVNPFKVPEIDLKEPTQRLLASHGLTLTNYDAEGLFSTKALKGIAEPIPGLNKAMDMVHKFSQWQFQDYIPRLKMSMAKEAFDRNTKRYPNLSQEQVAELSAKESNAAFGNLNTTFDSIPRTKTFKSLARLALFAPDFLESRVRFMGQAFTKYGGEQRAALIRSALVTYATMRIANALLNNGDAKWDPEHAFSLVAHGKDYSVRSVEQDALHAITDPRSFIYNRLNPLTTRPLTEFLSGRDQFGRQISPMHLAKETAKSTLPFGVQKVVQTPDEGWMNSLLTSIGLGSKNYRTPTEEAVHKLYIAGIPDSKDDEEKQAESRKLRGIEDKVRSGHMAPGDVWKMVEKKEITPKEAGRTVQRAQKTRLQIEFQGLHLKDAIEVYANASPLEQAELKPQLARKQALIAELPESQREKTAAKMQELLAMNNH